MLDTIIENVLIDFILASRYLQDYFKYLTTPETPFKISCQKNVFQSSDKSKLCDELYRFYLVGNDEVGKLDSDPKIFDGIKYMLHAAEIITSKIEPTEINGGLWRFKHSENLYDRISPGINIKYSTEYLLIGLDIVLYCPPPEGCVAYWIDPVDSFNDHGIDIWNQKTLLGDYVGEITHAKTMLKNDSIRRAFSSQISGISDYYSEMSQLCDPYNRDAAFRQDEFGTKRTEKILDKISEIPHYYRKCVSLNKRYLDYATGERRKRIEQHPEYDAQDMKAIKLWLKEKGERYRMERR